MNLNDGLRYVSLPSGGMWPVPREFYQLLPEELRH